MAHFMIVLILYMNLLNLSWIIKCLFYSFFAFFQMLISGVLVGKGMGGGGGDGGGGG